MSTVEKVYHAIAIDDDGRLCKDIPESACKHQPQNFFKHIGSLTLSKLADSFVDPKLILTWLLTHLGSSSTAVGLLVPVREAGALLPQLFFAKWVRTRQQRKWVWAAGAAVQGLAALAMVLCVVMLPNSVAGFGIVCCLLVLAVARSFCSVSYKDVLGKTVSKSTRGTATGTAGTLAAAGLISFSVLLAADVIELSTHSILALLGIAAGLWLISALNFASLNEEKGSTDGGKNASESLMDEIKNSFKSQQFRLFVIARGLLVSTALAPPYLIMLVQQNAANSLASTLESFSLSVGSGQLGLLLLASALASLLSSFFWGHLADRSSRKVLILAAILASVALLTTFVLARYYSALLSLWYSLPVLLFLLMVAYQGVRLGRSTHLVDMATEDTRASFTAVSNSAIGVLLVLGGGFGLLAQLIGVTGVILIFSLMCLLATLVAFKLEEVQG